MKAKIFWGTFSETSADAEFNEWVKKHPNITILHFQYSQARCGDHSICIIYRED